MALEEARTGTVQASSGAKRANTGTPFFGYIIAATLANTDFGDFFHNQIASAWLAFQMQLFYTWAMSTLFDGELATSAPWALATFCI